MVVHDKKQREFAMKRSTNKSLRFGPLEDRKCTDIFCLLLFFGFWVGLGMIGFYAYQNVEDFKSITYIYDQDGKPCKDDHSLLFFINDNGQFAINKNVCVDKCPVDAASPMTCKPDSTVDCSLLVKYPTSSLMRRVCWPSDPQYQQFLSQFKAIGSNIIMRTFSDLKTTWWMIAVVGLLSLILGFTYLFLLKHFAGILVWTVLLVLLLALTIFGVITGGCAWNVIKVRDFLPTFMENWESWQLAVTAITSWFLGFICFILICTFRHRINLSVAVIKTSTEFVKEEGHILLIPPLFFFGSLIFYSLWIFVFILLVQTNDIHPDENRNPMPVIDWKPKSVGMMIYYFFGLCWNHSFGVALSNFIVASSVCLWYFKKGKAEVGKSPIWKSVKRSLFHLGSIALSSFIVGILDFIRATLAFIHARVQQKSVDVQHRETGFILKCCECYLHCFEKSLKFLNRHAYIQIAMKGDSFCKSAEEAFYLAIRNSARFGVVHGLAWIFLFIGKIFISALSTFLGYLTITGTQSFVDSIYSPFSPTIFFFLISYFIGHVIMSVYGISADTIIHCFAMDEEVNDGIAKHAPSELREFINKHEHKALLS